MVHLIGRVSVSRETYERLRAFEALVLKWSKSINLVSKDAHAEIWERHILDSAQLFERNLPAGAWVDIGSGGGFPGVVAAIIRSESAESPPITLIESDQRKSTFLRTALRECAAGGRVLAQRVEDVAPIEAEILTARALAPITDLLHHAERHLGENGVAILHKGRNYEQEIDAARQEWRFDVVAHPSLTAQDSRVLEIRNIHRAQP